VRSSRGSDDDQPRKLTTTTRRRRRGHPERAGLGLALAPAARSARPASASACRCPGSPRSCSRERRPRAPAHCKHTPDMPHPLPRQNLKHAHRERWGGGERETGRHPADQQNKQNKSYRYCATPGKNHMPPAHRSCLIGSRTSSSRRVAAAASAASAARASEDTSADSAAAVPGSSSAAQPRQQPPQQWVSSHRRRCRESGIKIQLAGPSPAPPSAGPTPRRSTHRRRWLPPRLPC
jgi:hypothetical protein